MVLRKVEALIAPKVLLPSSPQIRLWFLYAAISRVRSTFHICDAPLTLVPWYFNTLAFVIDLRVSLRFISFFLGWSSLISDNFNLKHLWLRRLLSRHLPTKYSFLSRICSKQPCPINRCTDLRALWRLHAERSSFIPTCYPIFTKAWTSDGLNMFVNSNSMYVRGQRLWLYSVVIFNRQYMWYRGTANNFVICHVTRASGKSKNLLSLADLLP